MNFFILSQDTRISHAVEPLGVSQVITWAQLVMAQTEGKKELPLQFYIRENPSVEYVDFIERPVPFLADWIKELMKKYDPTLYTRIAVLTDVKRKRQDLYWILVPPRIACLSDQTEFHQDGTLKRLVIAEEQAAGHPVFMIDGIKEPYVCVNLAVAESLLRRSCTGIRFQKIETERIRRKEETV